MGGERGLTLAGRVQAQGYDCGFNDIVCRAVAIEGIVRLC